MANGLKGKRDSSGEGKLQIRKKERKSGWGNSSNRDMKKEQRNNTNGNS